MLPTAAFHPIPVSCNRLLVGLGFFLHLLLLLWHFKHKLIKAGAAFSSYFMLWLSTQGRRPLQECKYTLNSQGKARSNRLIRIKALLKTRTQPRRKSILHHLPILNGHNSIQIATKRLHTSIQGGRTNPPLAGVSDVDGECGFLQ